MADCLEPHVLRGCRRGRRHGSEELRLGAPDPLRRRSELFARDLRQLDGVGHDEQPLEHAPGLGVRAVQVLGVAEVDYAAAPCALGGNLIELLRTKDLRKDQQISNSKCTERAIL